MKKARRELTQILGEYKKILLRRFGSSIVSIALFGSTARNEFRETSDIDLFIVLDGVEGMSFGQRIDLLSEAEKELRRRGNTVQIQEYVLSRSELEKHPPIMLDLVTDAVILYDRGALRAEIEKVKARMQELRAVKIKLPDGRWYWDLKPDYKLGEVVEI